MQTSRSLPLSSSAALILALLVLPLASAALGQSEPPYGGNMFAPGEAPGWNFKNLTPEQQQRMLRFSTFVNRRIPEHYLKAENGVGYTTRAIVEGGPLYAANCRKCHGESGLGNGALASALSPSPALLAYMIQQPIAIDQYLLWSISEGGKQFGTAMPAFKDELTQEQIWKIVAYLRAGFPAVEEENKKEGGAAPPVKTDD
jgi:mono/diheme cytochrome c family protein